MQRAVGEVASNLDLLASDEFTALLLVLSQLFS